LTSRKGRPAFVFYEGPPSANGKPGIHHVLARTIKDIFCRYKTLQGYFVERKAGWDTHGLPVELGVEAELGITKEDIGKTISVKEYNNQCRKAVMKYTYMWEDITEKMGYWVDMDKPYITYDNRYIESVWYLLKELYKKDLLYKGYTIQPYSPGAGTGLSSHELNMPGCYQDVKDTTAVAQFKAVRNEKSEFLFENTDTDVFFLAWTTTPWTLPSNTALAVGKGIKYLKIKTLNPYLAVPVTVIMAKDLVDTLFNKENENLSFDDYKAGDKKLPFQILDEYKGTDLEGLSYEQLLPYQQPTDGDAFRVIIGDFVTTSDGTGIVHIAPSFGADDMRVAKQNGIGSLTLVNKKGQFIAEAGDLAGKYVKNDYDASIPENAETTDVYIVIKLKKENKAFKVAKYEHSYPHCWRTKKPILYYPLDSWFIKVTDYKKRMIELNKTINWKPKNIGEGRFGQWLENLIDWNLSRSRYWGTPLPIWRTQSGDNELIIGSVAELKAEIEKSVEAGFMAENPLKNFVEGDNSDENYKIFDLHKPDVDAVVLVSPAGEKMFREPDLIDVWFDSGAMPYAQMHYPFENQELFKKNFPADFIAEGVDQTRGWFYTLHAISSMIFDSVSFKNIISNGLVLDKDGRKMSKSRPETLVNPFEIIDKYGSDPMRWYMITNASPWDTLKFDVSGIEEVKRKFFGTLYNTYSFFALYANVDGFTFAEAEIPLEKRSETDRWVISLLNTLIKEVKGHYENYEPTRAGRAIQAFVIDNLSNWYVRLNRKRFWGGEYNENKIAAYQTLYTCLITVAKLASPIIPFCTDRLYLNLTEVSGKEKFDSIHLSDFPQFVENKIDTKLEERMNLAQRISSMVLGLRRKTSLKVRQPLAKIIIPILNADFQKQLEAVENIFLTEINVKEAEYLSDASQVLVKRIKPNFKMLGKKYGKQMKMLAQAINKFTQEDINTIETAGKIGLQLDNQLIELLLTEVEISAQDIPGWLVNTDGKLTVALDITITDELRQEGLARELINRIQNLRKDLDFEVTDKINVQILDNQELNKAVENFNSYISAQTLATSLSVVAKLDETDTDVKTLEIEEFKTLIKINKG